MSDPKRWVCGPCDRTFASARGLASHNGRVHPSTEATERRWNRAIDRILNSGRLYDLTPAFWQYVDGEISFKRFDEVVGP